MQNKQDLLKAARITDHFSMNFLKVRRAQIYCETQKITNAKSIPWYLARY